MQLSPFNFKDEWSRDLAGFAIVVLSIVTLSLNGLLFVAFLKTKQSTLNTSNFLITLILVSDFLNGLLMMPAFAIAILIERIRCVMALGAFVFGGIFGTFSVCLTVILTLDRYSHMNPNIERPSRLARFFQRPRLYVLIAVAIAIALLNSTIYFLTAGFPIARGVFMLLLSLFFVIILIFMPFAYVRGYLRIRNFVDNSPVYQNETGNSVRPQYIHRLYKTVLAFVAVALVSYMPLSIATALKAVYDLFNLRAGHRIITAYIHYSFPLLLSYPITSSIIILWQNEEARAWVNGRFFRCACHGNTNGAQAVGGRIENRKSQDTDI